MASSSDSWVKEFNEASKLADDINARLGERSSLPPTGPETQHHLSAIRRKITILSTRLDTLENLLPKLPSRQPIWSCSAICGMHNKILTYIAAAPSPYDNSRQLEVASLPPVNLQNARIEDVGLHSRHGHHIWSMITKTLRGKNMPIHHRFGAWESVYFTGILLAFLKIFMFNFLGRRC